MSTTLEREPRVQPPAPAPGMNWSDLLGKLGPLIGLIFVLILFSVLTYRSFVTIANAELILRFTAVVGIAALGMTLIIISGGIDLSVGSAIALVGVTIALLLPHTIPGPPGERVYSAGLPPILAAAGGVLAGAVCGLAIGSMVIGYVGRVFAVVFGVLAVLWVCGRFSGTTLYVLAPLAGIAVAGAGLLVSELLVKRLVLAPFIVTLGMWGALRGVAQTLASNTPVYPKSSVLEASFLSRLLLPISREHLWLLTPGVWMLLVLAVLVAVMLRYTRLGRHIFAVGSNEQTARLCGVNVERTKLLVYIIAGLCTGLAATLQFSYLGMADPGTAVGMELDIIAAVVIGGASLSGGQGSILGTLVGALMMTAVSNGCTKMGLANPVQMIVTGGIIILAVSLDRLRQRKSI